MSVFGGLVWSQRAITKGSFDLDLNPDGVPGDPFRGLTGSMRAMRLAYSYACVRITADWVAASPLQFYDRADGKTRVDPAVWYADPYPEWSLTPEEWMFQLASSYVMHGNAYGLIRAVDNYGLPSMVRWVSPLSMAVSADANDQLEYKMDQRVVPTSRIAHVRGVTLPGSCVGLSPVDLFRHVIDLGLSASDFTARWFTDGGHPTMHLGAKGSLSNQQAQAYKDRWDAATKGRRGVVVTGNDVSVNKLQESPKDSNAIEVQQQAGRDAATVWGVPAWFLGLPAESGMTYANVEQLFVQFQVGTLRFVTKRLEGMFNRWLPPSKFCKFNLDSGVRADLLTRMQAYGLMIQHRMRSVNEVRDLDDLPPAPWGDAPPALPEPPPTPREDGHRDN